MELNRVIAVRNAKTVYRDNDKCIKVFNEEYTKADVLNEALNQARIEETDINVPSVREVVNIDGKWAIVSDYISGKTLERLMQENPEKKDEYMELFVDLHLKIHSITGVSLNKLKDKMNGKICATDLEATTRYDLHSRLEEMPKHIKLCHGDFNPSNIIIADDGTPYIIDWSHASQGNASADAAITYLLFCMNDDEVGAKKYLEFFCEKTGVEKQYVRKWIPIAAASQSVMRNEREKEFLLSRVDA